MLVITSNISYAVTLSICGMTMKSSCSCDMSSNNSKDVSVKKEPCCKEEFKNISNSSDFESSDNIKILISSGIVNLSQEFVTNNYFKTSDSPVRFIFYDKSTDLPVRYSSLLI